MEILNITLIIGQIIFMLVAGLYFYTNLKAHNKQIIKIDSLKETEKLLNLRCIHLTEPLSEKTRPSSLNEIVGQKKGLRALQAAICGPNPQHVIIYGPAGVGKTAAARLVLELAKKNKKSPFRKAAKFVEIDATTLQFDERSIADPLIGSVHDPIYQGAGAFGSAGIPQPKAGAVTKAHGGILFIDEIGELHSIQMNKLLKVLEDRKVFLTSSYYNSDDKNIPRYIHDIFQNGLPADFRLIGATTRRPEEIPPALRSRCTEIFFDNLEKDELCEIAVSAIKKVGFNYTDKIPAVVSNYSSNGRDTVNMIQTAVSLASMEGRNFIDEKDIEDVIEYGRYTHKISKSTDGTDKIGIINGLAVYGYGNGILTEIEATVKKAVGQGSLVITGIAETEEIKNSSGKLIRKSTAKSSVENVITVFENITDIDTKNYNIHINFSSCTVSDGPSAGIAIFSALYSAFFNKPVSSKIAMTGELSITGKILPVGGVAEKIKGAVNSGITQIIIPKENYQQNYDKINAKITLAENISDILNIFKKIEEKGA